MTLSFLRVILFLSLLLSTHLQGEFDLKQWQVVQSELQQMWPKFSKRLVDTEQHLVRDLDPNQLLEI